MWSTAWPIRGRRANYGAKPGRVNPLPAWPGKPHAYDFTRFNVAHWQKAEYAVRRMREAGHRGHLHLHHREAGPAQGVRESEPRTSTASTATPSPGWPPSTTSGGTWATSTTSTATGPGATRWVRASSRRSLPPPDLGPRLRRFLVPKIALGRFHHHAAVRRRKKVHEWALKFRDVPKPYVNEEYGYEGARDVPGHAQNADRVRRCHWSIAMAGGYATYGDWSDGVSYFYMGDPGPGKAAAQLKHLRSFFESLPFLEIVPHDE